MPTAVPVPDAPPTSDGTAARIRKVALERLATHGTSGLGMRAIARDLGLTPGALYRHFDGLDDLLTGLIADGYHRLADAMQARVADADQATASRLASAAMGYREWAVANRHWFGLLFGPPIPGYAAPPAGPTNEGMERVGRTLLEPLVEAHSNGRLRPMDTGHLSAATRADLGKGIRDTLPDVPVAVFATALSAWGRLHGMVCLEVFGHLDWLLDDAGDLYRADLDRLLIELGMV